MSNGWHTQEPVEFDGFELVDDLRELRRQYYSGAQMPSPTEGFLEALHVRQEPDGSGRVLMECNASSIRYELPIPKATTRERTQVREQQDDGLEPTCPRHSDPIRRLQRAGQFLVCPLCGVRYGRPV